ncbi:17563_t:CDS:2, partial [Acaulospora colombiana]
DFDDATMEACQERPKTSPNREEKDDRGKEWEVGNPHHRGPKLESTADNDLPRNLDPVEFGTLEMEFDIQSSSSGDSPNSLISN